jgi:enamine deaminase RidA (YjgF/YER057c/UK114 family)
VSAGPLAPVDPDELGPPRGYSNGMLVPAGRRLLFVAGQVGWGPGQVLVEGGLVEQFAQALANVLAVVRAAGGGGPTSPASPSTSWTARSTRGGAASSAGATAS